MKLFDTLLTAPAVQMFGWALLHSLWQGIILTVLLKGALSLSKKASSNTRYLIACLTLLLMLLLPVSTALWSNSESQFIDTGKPGIQITAPLEKEAMLSATTAQIIVPETEASYTLWMHQAEKNLMPWIVLIWSFGVFISSLRLLGVWTYTQRLKQIEKHLILEQWKESVQKLSTLLRVSKPVILLESSLVKVPTVIGWLKPMILIPSCALTGLTPQQFELILAHELAHIRRHDYLVNLFQTIIETFLFYHPAAWWVSRQIRNERENACDDLAVSVSGDAVVYARTLIEMERLRKSSPSFAMAADGGSLTDRIHRLVGAEMSHSKRFGGLWVVILISIFMVTVGVTKENSSVIKERVGEVLSLNLSSITDSKVNEGTVENFKPRTPEENQKSKKLTEENARTVLPSESETDSTAKADNKPDISVEEDTNQETIKQVLQTAEILPLSEQPSEVKLEPGETIPSQVNIKYQQENKSKSQDESQDDFIAEMASLGYTNLTVDQLISLKSMKVTANYVRELRSLGFNNLTVKELTNMRVVDITSAYVEGLRNAGYKDLTAREFANFKVVGVTPELISKYKSAGYDNLPARHLSDFSLHGITTDFINNMNAIGFGKLSPRDLVSLKLYSITMEFIRTARNRLGNDLTLRQIIDLKKTGILERQG